MATREAERAKSVVEKAEQEKKSSIIRAQVRKKKGDYEFLVAVSAWVKASRIL